MKTYTLAKLVSTTILIFGCAAIPAFANHGGGGGGSHGGGGGFHGGGGSVHSGGGSYGGGGFRSGAASPPVAGYSRGYSSAPASGYARSGGNTSRSFSGPASTGVSGGQRSSSFSSAPRAVADGNWHSFGGGSASRSSASPQSEARGSANTGGGWQVFGGNRSASAGATRSFSGQGHDVWENTPASHNVVSASHALSNVHGSVGNTLAGNSGLRSGASLSASSRLSGGATSGNRTFSGSQFSNNFGGFNGRGGFGNSFYGFRGGFRGGCWNCGFGFGFGWWPGWGFGFGWPWFGYGGLYWNDPWWGWPGYGYYGYPTGYLYGGPDSDPYYDPYAQPYAGNDPNAQPPENYLDASSDAPPAGQSFNQNYPNQDSSQAAASANTVVPVLLYMKDGSVYAVRDYWVSRGQLHYVLLNGTDRMSDIDRLDLQRTVDENARSGVQFTLKPGPSSFGPAPNASPETAPAPAPQVNLTSVPT